MQKLAFMQKEPLSRLFVAFLLTAGIATPLLLAMDLAANLLLMVTVGGYETFVSRLRLDNHPDQPEWLDHVNASVLKVKLSMAIISISSIHLLQTFINAGQLPEHTIKWQLALHLAFLVSAAAIAYTDKLLHSTMQPVH